MAKGKKYRDAVKKYDRERIYDLREAVELARQLSYAKFDETVEVAIKLNVKKQTSIRDTFVFPHTFQKEQRILVFAKGDKAEEAKEAGATHVGAEELVAKIKDGWLDFDVAVATPDMMREVGKLGPILGRRGLMPNPKTRTVTMDVKGAVAELKKGRVEFRSDKGGVIHLAVGRVSMDVDSIVENLQTVIQEVGRKRPDDVKGEFFGSVSISTTMGPGVRVSAN